MIYDESPWFAVLRSLCGSSWPLSWQVKHLALNDSSLCVVWRTEGETGREKASDTFRSSWFVLCREFNQHQQQTYLCQASVSRKTNITLFQRIMMPQRRLCSHTEQLGQRESSECEKLFNRNQSLPQISSLVPGERLSGESTLPTAHQRSLRLEKHNCHCWRGRYASALLIGRYTMCFLTLSSSGTLYSWNGEWEEYWLWTQLLNMCSK